MSPTIIVLIVVVVLRIMLCAISPKLEIIITKNNISAAKKVQE